MSNLIKATKKSTRQIVKTNNQANLNYQHIKNIEKRLFFQKLQIKSDINQNIINI